MEKEKKMTMAEKVLRFIKESPTGRSFSEIQRFIVEGNGMTYSSKYRGYWCTNLCGTSHGDTWGLLEAFCLKTEDRRYVVVEEIKAPFFKKKSVETKATKLNAGHRERAYEIRKALAPKCGGCGRAITYKPEEMECPDRKACFHTWGQTYRYDCKGRVWARNPDRLTSLTENQSERFWNGLRQLGIAWSGMNDVMKIYIENHLPEEK